MSVIDKSEEFSLHRARHQFARLTGLVEQHRAAVEADPWPYIDALANRLEDAHQFRNAMHDALFPLLEMPPNDIYEFGMDNDPLRDAFNTLQEARRVFHEHDPDRQK